MRLILRLSMLFQLAGILVACMVPGQAGAWMIIGGFIIMVSTGAILGGCPDDC